MPKVTKYSSVELQLCHELQQIYIWLYGKGSMGWSSTILRCVQKSYQGHMKVKLDKKLQKISILCLPTCFMCELGVIMTVFESFRVNDHFSRCLKWFGGQLGVISPSGFLLRFCCAIQNHEITIKRIEGQLIKDCCIYSTCPYTAVQSQKAVSDYFTSDHILPFRFVGQYRPTTHTCLDWYRLGGGGGYIYADFMK